jgi:hypothetical protein
VAGGGAAGRGGRAHPNPGGTLGCLPAGPGAGLAGRPGGRDTAAEALFSHQLGTLALARDELEEARELLEHALQLRRQLADADGVAVTMHNLQLLAPAPTQAIEHQPDAAPRPGRRLAEILGGRRRRVLLARGGLLALLAGVILVRLLGSSPATPPSQPAGFAAPELVTSPVSPIGTTGQTTTIPIKGRDAAPLTIGSITLTNEDPGEFALQDHCTGSTVSQSAGCSLTASFRPTKAGDRSARVVIKGRFTT